jgi:hypothetical protein
MATIVNKSILFLDLQKFISLCKEGVVTAYHPTIESLVTINKSDVDFNNALFLFSSAHRFELFSPYVFLLGNNHIKSTAIETAREIITRAENPSANRVLWGGGIPASQRISRMNQILLAHGHEPFQNQYDQSDIKRDIFSLVTSQFEMVFFQTTSD